MPLIQELISGTKQKKGKDAEHLMGKEDGMMSKNKETGHGYQDKSFFSHLPQRGADGGADMDDAFSSPEKPTLDGSDSKGNSGKGKGKGGGHKPRDVARTRASLREKIRRSIAGIQKEFKSIMAEADQMCKKRDGVQAQYEHFFDILLLRRDILSEVTLNTSQDDFKNYLNGLPERLIQLQPIPKAVLENTPVVSVLQDLCQKLLTVEDKEMLDAQAKLISDHLSIHAQLRNALKSSAKDLGSAVKAAEKRAEKENQKQEKKRQADEAKKAMQSKKESLSSANGKGGKGDPRGGSKSAADLLRTPDAVLLNKLKVTPFDSFPDLKSVKEAGLKGDRPFVMQSFDEMKKLIADTPPLRCLLTNFSHQFPGSAMCVQSGRAQCPVKIPSEDAIIKNIQSIMLSACPFHVEADGFASLRPILRVAIFGFASDMTYSGYEERGMGQLRYFSQGARKILVVNPVLLCKGLGKKCDSLQELLQLWSSMDVPTLEKLEGGAGMVYMAMQKPGSLLYVPPGWLIVEQVINSEKAHGLRLSIIVKDTGCQEAFRFFEQRLDQGHPYKSSAVQVLQAME